MPAAPPRTAPPPAPASAAPPSEAAPGPRRDRRADLVDAAERTFARRGFHAATVPQIAADARVSVGLLYRYFPSKAALAVAIVERDRDRTRAGLAELLALVPDPARALAVLIDEWLRIALADRAACALVPEIAAEATRDPAVADVVRAADAEVVTTVAGLVARALPGRGEEADAVATAVALLAALDGLVLRVACDPAFDPRPAAAALAATLGLPPTEGATP